MHIGDLNTDDRVVIVAEIGNNHEGNVEVARELVVRAAEAGADAVKFQTFRTELYVSVADEERFRRLKQFELGYPAFEELAELAHSLGLLFLSTPFDLASADFLAGIVDALKVSSGDNNFFPLLERLAATRAPLVVSTGLSDLALVQRVVTFVRGCWAGDDPGLAVLQCVTSYPTPMNEVNLRAIPFLADHLPGCTVGFSDHTIGIEVAPLAVALGARIVEKHFTLAKDFSAFRDHALSADPMEMHEMVRRIRDAEQMLGLPAKVVQPSEHAVGASARRSIVAARNLSSGQKIASDDLTWVRPGGGLQPGEERVLLGRVLRRAVSRGEQLCAEDVE